MILLLKNVIEILKSNWNTVFHFEYMYLPCLVDNFEASVVISLMILF